MRSAVQALAIAPVTMRYLVSLPFGFAYVLFGPWTATGVTWFDAWILGSLALGGSGLVALWICILWERVERTQAQRVSLALGLIAGALVALAWLALRFTRTSEATPVELAVYLVEFGAPLALALRHGSLLVRQARPIRHAGSMV